MLYATMRIGNNCEYFLFQSYIVCYMGVLALTNNMITFTFFQSKITLSFALFQKCFSESAAKTLDSLGKVLYNGCDSFEKV